MRTLKDVLEACRAFQAGRDGAEFRKILEGLCQPHLLTRPQVADLLGTSRSTLRLWMHARHVPWNPNQSKLIGRLAEGLAKGVRPAWQSRTLTLCPFPQERRLHFRSMLEEIGSEISRRGRKM